MSDEPETVAERFDRIEAILRANGMHEPSCPIFVQQQNLQGGVFYPASGPCDCWLSPFRDTGEQGTR